MKTKRIASLLLCLILALSLLPTAALATTTIGSTHLTVTKPTVGQVLRTSTAKVNGLNSKGEVTDVQWSGQLDENNKVMYDVAYTVTITLKIKAGEDAKYSKSLKVYIGTGTDKPMTVEHISDTEVRATYTYPAISLAEKQAEQAAKEAEQAAKKAAEDALKIKNITITIAQPVFGQPLPATVSVAESDLVDVIVRWTTSETGIATVNNAALFTVTVKEGSDRTLNSTTTKVTVNGNPVSISCLNKSKGLVTYDFDLINPTLPGTALSGMPPANPVNVTYDTFDYRAYANIYPDVKAAYGYDAQKLWAHYTNYGKAEGRVAFAISASDNPKSGATIYKNTTADTDYSKWDGPSTVSATYLDPLPPSNVSQSYDPWMRNQLTKPMFMSNAKLVAEYYSIMDVIDNKKTGFNYDLVRMDRRTNIEGELNARCASFEAVYCYEDNLNTKMRSSLHVESEADIASIKASDGYQRAAQSDGIILLHWAYQFRITDKLSFPTPPANPGTAGQAAPSTPAKPAGPAVTLTKQNLTVNGAAKNTEIYNIDGSNYFKLRDMAALLNGTGSQFSVDFDSARSTIVVKTGAAYTAVGGELATGTDKSSTAAASAQSIEIDGKKADLAAYNIGGNNFFKLRDLGTALNFDVDYDGATSTMIVKSR